MQFVDEQAASRIELEDGTVITECDQCRQMWKERNERGMEGKPPCDTCRVELLESNADVADVFMLSRGQVITAGDKNMPIDISIPAIKAVMDMDRRQRRDLMRVQNLWHHFNNERGEE